MNELKSVYIDRTGDWVRSGNDTGKFYLKEEVDAVIADIQKTNVILSDNAVKLNRELDKLKKRSSCTFSDDCLRVRYLKRENEQLKAKLEDVQATAYAESVDAGMENRRLKRALFIAHAIKAKFKWWWMSECKHNESCKLFPDTRKIKKFTNSAWVCSKSQEKCRAKAEEYK